VEGAVSATQIQRAAGFLKTSALASAIAGGGFGLSPLVRRKRPGTASRRRPVARRTPRWMQTNIAEIDVTRHDIRGGAALEAHADAGS
jgi:hypothetical protein